MKSITRLLSTLLIAVFIVALLAGCSTSGEETNPSSATKTEPVKDSSSEEVVLPETTTTEPAAELKFEEVTVVDNEECTIKITGIDPENLWGYTLNAYFENKNSEKTYSFSVVTASVNGIEADPYFSAEVAPGKKANKEISFSNSALEENEIEFTDIEITFRVYDSNDWAADDVLSETVHIYPLGEENAVTFVREAEETDQVLVDNEQCKLTVIGIENSPIWGYSVNLYLENKTDSMEMFTADDVSVNGYMIDPYWGTTVSAGKVAFSSMTFSNGEFETNNIETVEKIELTIRIYNAEDFSADDYVNETLTINP